MGHDLVVKLEVVLATWNGGRYLHQQLESLWQQDLRPDQLLVFDDGSSDATRNILQSWQQRHPGWIQTLISTQRRLGVTAAFNRLLLHSTAPFVALCDQDDVWHRDRLATGVALLEAAEANHPLAKRQPLLLHSNATLIDAEGRQLEHTLWEWHRCTGDTPDLIELAQHNTFTGCTMLANRALLQQALPIPGTAVFHDHWLALVARQQGELIACRQSLLAHRRHGSNISGRGGSSLDKVVIALRNWCAKQRQWRSFCKRYQIPLLQRLRWWPHALVNLLKQTRNLKC
mgnify:CR=1 FL=1